MTFSIGDYRKYTYARYPEKIDTIYNVNSAGVAVYDSSKEDAPLAVGNSSGPYLIKWQNKKDLVLAEHVAVLQDIVYSIEKTLGVKPFFSLKTYKDPDNLANNITGDSVVTVAKRFTCIENIIPDDTHIWNLINSHVHGQNGLSAINLSGTQVTGLLDHSNIDLTMASSGTNATNILYGPGVSIKTAIDGKLSTSGGTITGDLNTKDINITGYTSSKSTFEAQGIDFAIGAGGAQTYHYATGGYSYLILGNSTKWQSGSGTSVLGSIKPTNGLMYGRYTAILRMVVDLDNAASDASISAIPVIFSITAGMAGAGITKTTTVSGTQLMADRAYFENNIRTFCITFDYGKGPKDVQDLTITVTYPAVNKVLVGVDNIVIVPAHTAIL